MKKKHSKWHGLQQQNYTNSVEAMADEQKRGLWEEFTTKYRKYFIDKETLWFNTLDETKQWIDENKRKPHIHGADIYERKLANWIYIQRRRYDDLNDYKQYLWNEFAEKYLDSFTKYNKRTKGNDYEEQYDYGSSDSDGELNDEIETV